MKLTNSFMVSARGINHTSSNPEMALETVKHLISGFVIADFWEKITYIDLLVLKDQVN